MPPTTETELKELKDLVIGLREEMRVGLAQVDTKLVEMKAELKSDIQRVEGKVDVGFAQVDTKLAQMESEVKGEIQKVDGKIDVIDERTKLGFWGFVGRAVIVSLLGFLILMAIKYALTGTIKLT